MPVSGQVVEGVEREHDLAHPLGEFLALLFDVTQECVGPPPPDEHDGIGRDALEIELHGQGRPVGVGADVVGAESERVAADG